MLNLFFFFKNTSFYLPLSLIKLFWWVVVGGLQVTLLFCFGPKVKFWYFDLNLDQAEQ